MLGSVNAYPLYVPDFTQPHLIQRYIRTRGPQSSLLAWEMHAPHVDHCEVGSRTGGWLGAHLVGGVQDRLVNYCDADIIWERRYAIPCTAEQLEAAYAFGDTKIGTRYDLSNIAGILFRDYDMFNKHREICSRFLYEFCWAGGLVMGNALEEFASQITPEMLHFSSRLLEHCYYAKT